jgi:hypothetical protein
MLQEIADTTLLKVVSLFYSLAVFFLKHRRTA